jgi:polyisoprenoid-binding protein YceI
MTARTPLLLAALLAPTAAFADKVEYAVDASNSLVYALVYKAGAAAAVAHDHVVLAEGVKGTVVWDTADPTQSSVDVEIEVARFMPDTDAMRQKVGLPNTLSEKQRSEILDHILADYQLDKARFTTIKFKSTSVAGAGTSYKVTGDFTLRGVTKSITVPMIVIARPAEMRAGGKFRIVQSDYGYKPYSAMFGALKVKDEVDIVMNFKLAPK